MRAAISPGSAIAVACAALVCFACAADDGGRTVLAGMGAGGAPRGSSASLEARGPTLLRYRGPSPGGDAYRLTVDIESERGAERVGGDPDPMRSREAHLLEAHFRAFPVEKTESGKEAIRLGLDALRYTVQREIPASKREIELADDRLRVRDNDEVTTDARGIRTKGPVTPRMLLERVFGVIRHDPNGNPIGLSDRGSPAAREFLAPIPLLTSIAYTMLTLSDEPVVPGSHWNGVRVPPRGPGEYGMAFDIRYSLAGFETFAGVPCAMILLDSELSGVEISTVTGHRFDRIQASLHGNAWVELESSRVRRLAFKDQIDAEWSAPNNLQIPMLHRLRFEGEYALALRDPGEKLKRWSDGTPVFQSR